MSHTLVTTIAVVSLSVINAITCFGQSARIQPGALVYIEDGELTQALSAAILKKKVPVQLTMDRDHAQYIMTSVTAADAEKVGERIAKVVILGAFAGPGKSRDTSISVIDRNGIVLFAYTTRKVGVQSASEGVAKHLKKHIEGK
jgi:hypothetical protein